MELKQWMGLTALGLVVLLCSAAMNDPVDIFASDKSLVAPTLDGIESGAPAVAAPTDKPATEAPQPEKVAVKKPVVIQQNDTQPAVAAPKKDVLEVRSPVREDPSVHEAPEKEVPQEPVKAKAPASGAKGHTIRGVVTYVGKPKSNPLIDMSADAVCKATHADKKVYKESYIINDGKVANVVVYLYAKSLPKKEWPVRKGEIILDQKGCVYTPHVIACQVGQTVKIRNSDPTTHNVHLVTRKNGDWNKSQPKQGDTMPMVQPFKRGEVGTASFKCDLHPWMECKSYVFTHPFFAITKEDGTFSIDCTGLPNGEYVLMAFHEKFKTKYKEGDKKGKVKIKLTDAGVDANFTFTGKKKKK